MMIIIKHIVHFILCIFIGNKYHIVSNLVRVKLTIVKSLINIILVLIILAILNFIILLEV